MLTYFIKYQAHNLMPKHGKPLFKCFVPLIFHYSCVNNQHKYQYNKYLLLQFKIITKTSCATGCCDPN